VKRAIPVLAMVLLVIHGGAWAEPPVIQQAPNSWVKRSPLKDASVSPGLGYEGSLAYDPVARRVIRWAGHNQGGGGEQNAETWILDPVTMKWELKEPGQSPPGACCNQQNVFDLALNRFLRFPAFSGSHGWHWFRENYLNNTSVWAYDLVENTWRDLRPAPAPHPSPLRCASWDSHHQVVVIFGGEGSTDGTLVYDPYGNTWARMRPRVQPAFRSGGNMAYDAARRLHILFGSQFSDDPHTWAYDLAKNEWRDMKPARQPPTNRNDVVLAYDAAGKAVIAVVRVADQVDGMEVTKGHLETWAYDSGKNDWRPLKPAREPDGWGNRRRVLTAVPDQQVLLMEAYVNPAERVPGVDREQQIWTYRYGEVRPAALPEAPAGLAVTTHPGKAVLGWQASPAAAAYKLYRGEGNVPWSASFKEIARLPGSQTKFIDLDPAPGKIHYYYLRAVGADGTESDDSAHARTQPRLVEDAAVSVMSPREALLTWKSPRGDGVVGYQVERAVVEVFSEDEVLRLKKDTPPLPEPSVGALKTISPFKRLTKGPIALATFTDTSIDLSRPRTAEGEPVFAHRFRSDQLDPKGKPYRYAVYAYRVRAVNALGVESGPSPYVLTIPSAPQWLFAREKGAACDLKWAAGPEKGLAGYRIYRMEGPRINGPGQKVTRLTDAPVRELRYTDPVAGQDTRRYWAVAVDLLGQEGFPSAPAWHYRQYRKYYEPFVGEWHQ
jgi:hypothetical protein